jgi:hypothetical protein
MREELLHFIWRHRYFNQQELFTEAGESLQILSPGELHRDQGPDCRNARIIIGGRSYTGPVEIHVRASDWVRHAHDGDDHYRDTILHVVWENDWRGGDGKPPTPGGIPILVLQSRVPKLLLDRYDRWMKGPVFVPCEGQLGQVDHTLRTGWQRELVLQRLHRRMGYIQGCLEANKQHWEGVAWQLIAQSMGSPVNKTAFGSMARSLPVELLARHRSQPLQLEALLLGQAGLLEGAFGEDYPQSLQREYRFLQTKWGLRPVGEPVSFLRMRPAHFPTVRLVQLAALMGTGAGWLPRILEAGSPWEILAGTAVAAGGYWANHWTLERRTKSGPHTDLWMKSAEPAPKPDRLMKPANPGPKRLGPDMQQCLLVNAFIPLLYAYGCLRNEPAHRRKALDWLKELKAERNVLLSGWRRLGVSPMHAADGQALLELKQEYCNKRRCLDCAIGCALLGQE